MNNYGELVQSQPVEVYSGKKKFPVGRFLFFMVWPFGSMISSLANFRNHNSKIIFWLFCIFFGLVFIYEDPAKGIFGADSARYAAHLIHMHSKTFSFSTLISSFYDPHTQVLDIYQPLVTWLISFLTDDPRWLFACFAAVFGYFYAKNLWFVFDSINKKVGFILLMFMITYALINPIWNINGVRMWTAAQIFVYGLLLYYLNNDKKGLIWISLSFLFHFSFLFPEVIFLTYLFIPKKARILYIFYIATVFIDEINLLKVRSSLSFLPDIFQPRIEGYTNQSYADNLIVAKSLLKTRVIWAYSISNWIVYIWVTALFLRIKHWSVAFPEYYRLFLFALFFGGIAHLASNVPSGSRFMTISDMLFYAVIILILGQKIIKTGLSNLEFITLPFILFLIIFQIRVGLDYIGFLTFIGNPFIGFISDKQTPIIAFIKNISFN